VVLRIKKPKEGTNRRAEAFLFSRHEEKGKEAKLHTEELPRVYFQGKGEREKRQGDPRTRKKVEPSGRERSKRSSQTTELSKKERRSAGMRQQGG